MGGTEREKRATLCFFSGGIPPETFFILGGSNFDVQLLSSHMEYEFNIIYFTIYSLLDIKGLLTERL